MFVLPFNSWWKSGLQCKVALHVIGAGLCNTVFIRASLLALPFSLPPTQLVLISLSSYLLLLKELLLLWWPPVHQSASSAGVGGGGRQDALGPFFFKSVGWNSLRNSHLSPSEFVT